MFEFLIAVLVISVRIIAIWFARLGFLFWPPQPTNYATEARITFLISTAIGVTVAIVSPHRELFTSVKFYATEARITFINSTVIRGFVAIVFPHRELFTSVKFYATEARITFINSTKLSVVPWQLLLMKMKNGSDEE